MQDSDAHATGHRISLRTTIALAALAAGLVWLLSIAEARADAGGGRDPNKDRGPVRTSIDALKRQYSDDTFSGGPRLQAALGSALPANGTLVSNDCGTTWRVGMQVRAAVDAPGGMPCVVTGETGTVVSSSDGLLLVEWHGKSCGHDGNGNALSPRSPNDGAARWFVPCASVVPTSNFPPVPVSLDFIGLQQNEGVAAFYDGGLGSRGSGPGPQYGANFDANTQTYYTYNGSGSPNPGVVSTFSSEEMIMTLDEPIGSLSFFFTSRVGVTVRAYSGANGTGTVVGTTTFSANTSGPSGNVYNTWQPLSWNWASPARSIKFTGPANFWAIDKVRYEISPPPGIRLAGPREAGVTSCFSVGNDVFFDVYVDSPPFAVAAGQFAVEYDRTVLDFQGILPGDSPYTLIPVAIVDEAAGTLFWVSSVTGGGTGSSSSSRMARLHFRAIQDDCNGDLQVAFDPMEEPIVIAAGSGSSTTLPLSNPLPVTIDSSGPVFQGVPASQTIPADAGGTCRGTLTLTTPTASDPCTATVPVTFTRSDGAATLNAPWPCGSTTVTWRATDACGRTSTATTTVTVTQTNLVQLAVSYEPIAGVAYAPSMTRCIDLRMGSGATVSQVLTFVNGSATATFEVPFGTYTCATVDDRLHSLVSRTNVTVQGTRWRVDAIGGDALRNGDLDNDNLVNVVDWSIYVVREGMSMPVNTNCATTGFHPDFDGSGTVTSSDGLFITTNFLFNGDSPCGTAGSTQPPLMRIPIDELAAIMGPDAALADLNGDGMVDVQDIERWQKESAARGGGTRR